MFDRKNNLDLYSHFILVVFYEDENDLPDTQTQRSQSNKTPESDAEKS